MSHDAYASRSPVGMNLGEPLFTTTVERDPTSRAGVTCVAGHRIPANCAVSTDVLPAFPRA
jgi:hypothetical protein